MPPAKKKNSRGTGKTSKKSTSQEQISEDHCDEDSKRVKKYHTRISAKPLSGDSNLKKTVDKKKDILQVNENDVESHDSEINMKLAIKRTKAVSSAVVTRKRKSVKTETVESLLSPTVESDVINKSGKKYIGAHVSIGGGLHNAVSNALEIGAKAFALFLKSQRQWESKPLTEDIAAKFRQACKDHNYPPHLILPHGSYLLNCGSPKKEILDKSRAALVDELKRCEMLGLTMFNFHPGSTCGEISIDKCLDLIAESINLAHQETKYVVTVIENMSCQGNTIGGDFKELRGIIDRVKDKSRIGICLDSCHAFAAGYDLATEEGYKKMMEDFESIIGLKYLKGVHLNDSEGKVGCHLDRHANIGRGNIGLKGFKRLMQDHRFDDIPLILETPAGIDDIDEIKLLYSLCK